MRAALIGLLAGLAMGALGMWRYDVLHTQAAQVVAITKTLHTDREYDQLAQTNATLAAERNAALATVSAHTADVVRTRGLYVRTKCVPPTASSSSVASDASAEVRLSDGLAEHLRARAEGADAAAAYAQVGHDYAVLMTKWRKEQVK